MRHPFDGIIVPQTESCDATQSSLPKIQAPAVLSERQSRRAMLAALAAGGAALTGLPTNRAAAAEADEKPANASSGGHALYFVVPKDMRRFSPERRKQLNILGSYMSGFRARPALRNERGFQAWLTEEEARRIATAADVKAVHKMGAKDTLIVGQPHAKTKMLSVILAPNGWRKKPSAKTYESTDQLVRSWGDAFKKYKDVAVRSVGSDRFVYVSFGGKVRDDVLEAIKSHPQVYYASWVNARATTLAVGEEGGRVTTQALGEEGDTTKRLGEEGGTTKRVGEEGGVTTKALGAEGKRPKPTTPAVGEEGKRPPKVTTKRLGEEGTKTTLALGEEGGKKPPRKTPPGRATTLALGEEGGKK